MENPLILTRRQQLERRKAQIYQDPALTDRGNFQHRSLKTELEAIQKELFDMDKEGQ